MFMKIVNFRFLCAESYISHPIKTHKNGGISLYFDCLLIIHTRPSDVSVLTAGNFSKCRFTTTSFGWGDTTAVNKRRERNKRCGWDLCEEYNLWWDCSHNSIPENIKAKKRFAKFRNADLENINSTASNDIRAAERYWDGCKEGIVWATWSEMLKKTVFLKLSVSRLIWEARGRDTQRYQTREYYCLQQVMLHCQLQQRMILYSDRKAAVNYWNIEVAIPK